MLRSLRTALVALALSAPLATAQPYVFDEAVQAGGPDADRGEGVALTADGSRYVVGTFEGTAAFGDVSIASAGDSDAFLVKYDADLQAVWARRAGTAVFNDFGTAVAVAPDGSVYAAGYFTGVATWDGGDNPDIELTTFSDFDAFVAKYTPSGDLAWVRQAGGTGQDTGRDLAVDASGNVYFVGGFEGTGTFGNVVLESAGSTDAFLVKYDADGEVVWARRGGSDQGDLGYGVAVDGDDRAHVSGSFRGVAVFGGLPLQSAGSSDVFVVQYDADGEPVWVEGIGADGSEFTRGGGIGLASDGSVYVQGSFSNTILVGSDVLASTGFTDIFVAKLTAEGDEVWGRRGGGDGTNFSAALAVDASGNVLTTGYVDGSGTFTDEAITTQGRDGYFAVINSAGDLLTVELLGGTGQDAGAGVAAMANRFAATGAFRSTSMFGDLELTSAGSSDVYLLGGNAESIVPSVIFVDADAIGTADGTSWTNAFTDLQDALALAATFGVEGLHIWVAEGIYRPTDDGDRTVSFDLVHGVDLYGGFAGTETDLDQRDWEVHVTTLSGDIGAPSSHEDNTFNVLVAPTGGAAIVDGFVVTQGNASESGPTSRGGGLYCDGATIVVRDVLFTGNRGRTSAGAHLNACEAFFFRTDFVENVAQNFGPDNFSSAGGLFINEGVSTLIKVRFIRNRAESFQFASGGGLFLSGSSSPALINVQFLGNVAGGSGGTCEGGAVSNFTNATPRFINTTFIGNQCPNGYMVNNLAIVELIGSVAVQNQGGIGITSQSALKIYNSILWRNGSIELETSTAIISHSIVSGGYDGVSILDASPRFVRFPASGDDDEWGTEDDDYGDLNLQEVSPVIDFGLTEFLPPDTYDLDGDGDTEELLPLDLDGHPRVLGSGVDLGAYESPFTVALEPGAGVPTKSGLAAAFPNPFRDRTTLALDIAESQTVTVEVFDLLGRHVATVHDGPLEVGAHRVAVDAGALPAGVYVVRAQGEEFSQSQRLTVVR